MSGVGSSALDLGRELVKNINWSVTANVFGSFHSTLVGLIVETWCSMDMQDHYVLEAPPVVCGVSRIKADALLYRSTDLVGIVEVEGSRVLNALSKLRDHAKAVECRSDLFALCVAYQYEPRGGGDNRAFRFFNNGETLDKQRIGQEAQRVSEDIARPVVLVTVCKQFNRTWVFKHCKASNYAEGGVCKVACRSYKDGKALRREEILWPTPDEFTRNRFPRAESHRR